MARGHNKKRNVGIVYELLLRHISDALIRDDKQSAGKALRIIETRFHKSTELYKEFRLFNALAQTTVSDTPVAASILTEAKHAARRCNTDLLDREKSLLIHDINHNLEDTDFYYRRIEEYKTYATIQTLLNGWRELDRSDLSKIVEFEGKIVEWLLAEKEIKKLEQDVNPDVDALVVKILSEKFNEKYGSCLNETQRDLIKSYVFSIANDSGDSIKKSLISLRETTLSDLSRLQKKIDNQTLMEKMCDVKERIVAESIDDITDATISRFLVISQLKDEITEALNE